jgi:uncharacterized membrane protein YbhN (UPF0104 family)
MDPDDCLDRPGESTWHRIARLLFPVLRVVLACAIVTLLVIWVRPEELVDRFSGIRPFPGLLAFAGTLFMYWLGAARLQLLARSGDFALSWTEAISLNLAAVFYGLFLPGGSATGWAVRLIRLAGNKSNAAAALFVLGCDRALATASLAVIGVMADLWLGTPAAASVSIFLFSVMFGTTLMAVFLLAPSTRTMLAPIANIPLLCRLARLVRKYQTPVTGPQYRVIVTALFLSVCIQIAGIAVWVLLARSVGIGVDLVVIAWVRSASMLFALLPATVGGLGLREAMVMYLLASFGVSGADALSLSLSVFMVTVFGVGLFGGLVEVWHLATHQNPKDSKTSNTSLE